MEILIFKTNIQLQSEIEQLTPHLSVLPEIQGWNVDLEDRDKILRIEAQSNITSQIQYIMEKAGYLCYELED